MKTKPLINQIAEVVDVDFGDEKIGLVTLKMPSSFQFQKGQYIWLGIKDVSNNNETLFRVMSICSSEANLPLVELMVYRTGSKFKKSLEQLKKRDRLVVSGPFGHLSSILNKNDTNKVVALVSGAGIAPILSKIEENDNNLFAYHLIGDKKYFEKEPFANRVRSDQYFKFANADILFDKLCESGFLNDKQTKYIVLGSQQFVNEANSFLNSKLVGQIYFEEHYPGKNINILESEIDFYKKIVDDSPSHIVITDDKGVIKYANKAAEMLTGYSLEEMVGQTPRLWGGLMSELFYEEMWQSIKKQKTSKLKVVNRRKDGAKYDASLSISSMFDKEGRIVGYIGTEDDVTEIVKIKDAFKREADHSLHNMKKLETLIDSLGEAVCMVDENGKVVLANAAYELVTGYKKSELLGRRAVESIRLFDANDDEVDESDRLINQVLSTKSKREGDFKLHKKGDGIVSIHITITPVLANTKLLGAVQVIRDITKEKEIDTLKNSFIALASHQLRTPLSIVKWSIEDILQNLEKTNCLDIVQIEKIKKVDSANEKMIYLVNKLLTLSRVQSGQFKTNLVKTSIVVYVKDLLKQYLKDNVVLAEVIKFVNHIDIDAECVVDQKLFREVIINLLSNAEKYSTPKSEILIELSILDGNKVLISVTNIGIGIPEIDYKKIFSSFYRASNVHGTNIQGTGIGLYLSKVVVEDVLKGEIGFESELGEKTKFWFTIPISK
ncbi:MAG: PAS domain S-box protein [Patescibacteria group bacterium]